MKYSVIFLILIGFVGIAYATEPEPDQGTQISTDCGEGTTYHDGVCVVDKSQNMSSNSSGMWVGVVDYPAHPTSIENINGSFYYMSEPFELNSNLPNISFHDVLFTSPYTTTPPRYIYSDVTFFDGAEDTLQVIFTYPDFTEHTKPQAGFIATSDGYHFLVSVNLEELPPLKQFNSGIAINEIQCKDGLVLLQKYNGSPACVMEQTKLKLIERGWTEQITDVPSKYEEMHDLKKLLTENNINYLPDKLVVTHQITFLAGDPACGAVADTDSNIHWFGIDSISEPKKITLYSENPNQCEVNTTSCFCSAQRKLTALTLDELSYFTLQEEEKYAEILIDYLGKENINRTPKFQIGKFNLNYTDSLAVGYCGELWGTNTYDFFEGAFVKNAVKDYSIDKELSPLCAISDDAKWWERK